MALEQEKLDMIAKQKAAEDLRRKLEEDMEIERQAEI